MIISKFSISKKMFFHYTLMRSIFFGACVSITHDFTNFAYATKTEYKKTTVKLRSKSITVVEISGTKFHLSLEKNCFSVSLVRGKNESICIYFFILH